jgi:hypothetical protein
MSVSVSYPGIYIQELPLSAHTITPAPTSIARFRGLHASAANAGLQHRDKAVQLY